MSRKNTVSDPKRSWGSFPRGQSSRGVKLTKHICLLPVSSMFNVLCSLYAFILRTQKYIGVCTMLENSVRYLKKRWV